MKGIVSLFFVLMTCVCGGLRGAAPDPAGEILAILDMQVASWNDGDMAGYMKYYWRSPDLTFHSGARLLSGWETVDSMYREKYSGPERGVLAFSDCRVTVLSVDSAYVTGVWRVQIPGTLKEGRFTLVLRRLDEGWRIVHDHSS